MDIFLNQLIQFYSNNTTNLHHLTTHSTTVLPYEMAIVLQPQIYDVISPMYSLNISSNVSSCIKTRLVDWN